jgi:hypothetical protein
MNTQFIIPDPETRAKSSLFQSGYTNAKLREACRQLDLANLMLDEALAKPTGGNRISRCRFTQTTPCEIIIQI